MADFLFPANDPGLDLLNTRPDGGDDRLKTTDDLIRWLDASRLIQTGGRPWRWNDKADPLLPRVKGLREGLRKLVEDRAAGRAVAGVAIQQIENAARSAPADASQVSSPDQVLAVVARAAAETLRKIPADAFRRQSTPDGAVWVYQAK
jgi:predicted RNA-binding Zn ribbon-like protein